MSYLSPSEQLNVWKQQRQAEQDRKFAPMWEMAEQAHKAKVQQNADKKTADLVNQQRIQLGLDIYTPEQIKKVGIGNFAGQTQIDKQSLDLDLIGMSEGIENFSNLTPLGKRQAIAGKKLETKQKLEKSKLPEEVAKKSVAKEYYEIFGKKARNAEQAIKSIQIHKDYKAIKGYSYRSKGLSEDNAIQTIKNFKPKADTETYKEISKYGIDVKNVSNREGLNNFLKAQPDIKNAKEVLQKDPIQLKQEYEAKTKELAEYEKRPPGERGKIYDKLEKDIKTLQQEMKFLDGVQQFLSKDEVVTGQTQQTAQSQKQVKYKPIVQGAIDYINNPNDPNYDPVKAKDAMTKLVNLGIDTSVFTVDISEMQEQETVSETVEVETKPDDDYNTWLKSEKQFLKNMPGKRSSLDKGEYMRKVRVSEEGHKLIDKVNRLVKEKAKDEKYIKKNKNAKNIHKYSVSAQKEKELPKLDEKIKKAKLEYNEWRRGVISE